MRVKFSSKFWIMAFCSLMLMSSVGVKPMLPEARAQTETPNPGPRSPEEAKLLFDEGTQSIAAKNYETATKDLERFVQRYPDHEKIQDAYLSLLDSLFAQKKNDDLIRYAKEFLNLKVPEDKANHARRLEAEANLDAHEYLTARILADELLKNHPNDREKALAHSVKFQAFLEEKQYREARDALDDLDEQIKKNPIEPFTRLIPEFKMTLAVRECTISHLIKNKEFEEDELTDYFESKNLCFKSALPNAVNGMSDSAVQEWCESFTYLNHELEKMRVDKFLKEKLNKELKDTFEFSKPISPGFSKCYEPYKPPKPKSKKRHRKRRVHTS